ncbi:putative pachytene checkpoint component Pch2 [Phyllosticta capitalensis]
MTRIRSSAAQKPLLHVEVRLKNTEQGFLRTDLIRDEVSIWLRQKYSAIVIGQEITGYEGLMHAENIESVNAVEYTRTDAEENDTQKVCDLEDVQLDVQAYELHGRGDISMADLGLEDDEEKPEDLQLHVTDLPNISLERHWESYGSLLVPRHESITRMLSIMQMGLDTTTDMNWNGLMLLYGPPGSGKTTLCRGLAQKLTIRLGSYFTRGKLVEICAQSLLSKWFGESGKLVSKIFEKLEAMALDEMSFICVMIDEVETLTGSRERSMSGSECGDAMRYGDSKTDQGVIQATNQLLTALDRLRHRSNIVVLCTSNLIDALDSAFLDRVDIKQLVPNPEPRAIYEILRSCINKLIQKEILEPLVVQGQDEEFFGDGELSFPSAAQLLLCSGWEDEENDGTTRSPAIRLWRFSEKCEGMSGRALRRLPLKALARHTYSNPVALETLLDALEKLLTEDS